MGTAVHQNSSEYDNRVERSGCSLAVVDHHSRCAVLMFHDEQLVVVPFKQGTVGAASSASATTTEESSEGGEGGDGGEGGEGSEGSSRRGRVKQRLRAAKQQNTPLTGRYSSLVLEPYVLALKDLGPKTGEMLLNRFFSIVVPTMAVVLHVQID